MRVAIITTDEDLVERIGVSLATRAIKLTVASTREAAQSVLASGEHAATIVDGANRDFLPFVAPCSLFGGGEDCLLLILSDDVPVPESGVRSAAFAYERADVAILLRRLVASLFPELPSPDDPVESILGDSPAVQLVREQIRDVVRFHDISVLILGETGTGKELAARALHDLGTGPDRPFVAINCAAIPEGLFESELFGSEAGAYTGARGVRVGLLEAAAGGTVFLDEIGEMPAATQPKLLRALESREFRRVGSNRSITLTARIVSATNRNPWLSDSSPLRPDLLYRLAGFTLLLPPLRARNGDVELLAGAFTESFAARHGNPEVHLDPSAVAMLRQYTWPGNVRELRAVVEHACVICRDATIRSEHVRAALEVHGQGSDTGGVEQRVPRGATPRQIPTSTMGLRDVERELISQALDTHGGNVSRAARALQIPRSTLREKIKRYGLR